MSKLLGLRVWGSDRLYNLPHVTSTPLLIGSSRKCSIRLAGPNLAPKHAQLNFDGDHWSVRAFASSHGLRQDGICLPGLVLTPGVEVRVGDVTLVAESEQTARLRAFCQRLLGWDVGRMCEVDHALRAIRLARTHRAALVLRGDGDLVPIALALHRLCFGAAAPFIVCDRRRQDTPASVRSPANFVRGTEALAYAVGGTLCLRHARLPGDVDEVIRQAHDPVSEVQLVVCADSQDRSAPLAATSTIEIPLLRIRELELSRIVQEYAEDAAIDMGSGPGHFNDEDRDWVVAHCSQSLPEIEKATLRIVALSASRSISEAAALLGMAPVSLARWLDRRPSRPSLARVARHDPQPRDALAARPGVVR